MEHGVTMQTRGILTKTRSNLSSHSSANRDLHPKANSHPGVGFCFLSSPVCIAITAALFLMGFSGCQHAGDPVRPDVAVWHAPTSLAPGDVIKLTFPGTPEFNQSQKIRPDGRISLPLVGEVDAAGSTVGELQARLARLYKSQLENTEVVVALENRAIPVYVCGAVNRPGKVVIDRPVSTLEAIMEAGGFTPNTADMSRVHLIRIENGRHTTRILNINDTLKARQTVASYVKPYDVIYVPESLF